jgi:RNA polymerase sigma-32 factor
MALSNATHPDRLDRRYIAAAMDAPLLEREHEANLARRWRDKRDEKALHEIIEAHIRLVVRIAGKFRGYGLPLADLIQEGNTGLMEAANRFDPERDVRFSTYATWWIMAAIQEYIVRNSSIVRIGTTPAQKSLFFNLRRLRARIGASPVGKLTDDQRNAIARELGVPVAAVERMEAHMSRPDRSLNATVGDDDSDELQDFLPDDGPSPEEIVAGRHDGAVRIDRLNKALDTLTPRERQIIVRRFLEDDGRTTLAEIGTAFGVTKERIRQIEGKALDKLRDALNGENDSPDVFPR